MGGDKTTVQSSQTQRVEETDMEKRVNELLAQRMEGTQEGTIQAQQSGLELANQMLTGQELPGYLSGLQGGISPEAIGQQASMLANKYGAGFQNMGIVDSGTAFKETSRGIANELLFPAEQFNIGNLQNLLNLALSGQAQVQSPIAAGTGQLSQNLQGLRTTTGTGSQTTTAMNPFWKSLQTSVGSMPGQLAGTEEGAKWLTFG